MPDREKVIKEWETVLSRDPLDAPWDLIDETLTLLKEQETVVRCKECEHATMTADGKMCKYCEMDTDDFGDQREVYHDADWFCADGDRKKGW